MAEAITNGPRDMRSSKFVVTNFTESLSLSGTEASAAAVALVLTTVIKELKDKGVLEATVA